MRALKVLFLGTFLPRRCGIATYTHDLRQSMAEKWSGETCPVIALNDSPEVLAYSYEVVFQITEQDISSYERAARNH